MAASTAGLVPITRGYLAKFYDRYPFEPISAEVGRLRDRLHVMCDRYDALRRRIAGEDDHLVQKLLIRPPRKIDENLWRQREQIEEIVNLLDAKNLPCALRDSGQESVTSTKLAQERERMKDVMLCSLNNIISFQAASQRKIADMVFTYLPKDFRGTLIRQQRERSERRREAEVEALIASGASIRERYQLLWNQQMDRRRTLAQLGSATGVFKALVKYLGGVPQVLLDFVRQINDHNGPMEEQRDRYGPPLYELTAFLNQIFVFLSLWWKTFEDAEASGRTAESLELLTASATIYSAELKRFLHFIGEVFDKSPFLISAEEAIEVQGAAPVEEFKTVVIARGDNFKVDLVVEAEGSMVAWEFRTDAGKDLGFTVEFVDMVSGMKMPILPYQRYEAHQGHFYTTGSGSYRLVWDNSYSTFYGKSLRYKADAVPPMLLQSTKSSTGRSNSERQTKGEGEGEGEEEQEEDGAVGEEGGKGNTSQTSTSARVVAPVTAAASSGLSSDVHTERERERERGCQWRGGYRPDSVEGV
ncbi:hypothetical protein CBR_g279 [Chara braunii]|uniref:GOLD domain-containing protein n=1 Tax=Chara braunii TaxID=69332 RepID=A0A388JM33_CHABU|nr:hypothetical protein CBR_g279 [Chara braunii]|eukprot:GBG58880.1 hypothetical protein CBR_g279 [Chara braunii]